MLATEESQTTGLKLQAQELCTSVVNYSTQQLPCRPDAISKLFWWLVNGARFCGSRSVAPSGQSSSCGQGRALLRPRRPPQASGCAPQDAPSAPLLQPGTEEKT